MGKLAEFWAGVWRREEFDERSDAVKVIRDFLEGTGGPHDWDEFISCRRKDSAVVEIQRLCNALPSEFPPEIRERYCGELGLQRLRVVLTEIERNWSTPRAPSA